MKQLPSSKPDSLTQSALSHISPNDFLPSNLSKIVCLQKSFLYASFSASSVFAINYSLYRSFYRAGRWGVASFVLVAVANYENCRYQRRLVQDQLNKMGHGTVVRG